MFAIRDYELWTSPTRHIFLLYNLNKKFKFNILKSSHLNLLKSVDSFLIDYNTLGQMRILKILIRDKIYFRLFPNKEQKNSKKS